MNSFRQESAFYFLDNRKGAFKEKHLHKQKRKKDADSDDDTFFDRTGNVEKKREVQKGIA
eukprot:m.909726 g.909726  ORF g.909726 m.909726 type:complete len:60 (+) comp60108_c0_seq66:569-748(+)